MKRKLLLPSLLLASLSGSCLGQTSKLPLTRAEILGRLASGSSRSYIAHLVKTRGINFSPDAHYLSLISLAGGNGILYERISAANASSPFSSLADSDPPLEHLAKCAEFLQSGAALKAAPECRAAIEENPQNPWPLLATGISLSQSDKQAERIELAQRAVAQAPDLAEAHKGLAYAFGPGEKLYAELHKAGALNPDDLDLIPQLSNMLPDGSQIGGTAIDPKEDPQTPDPETRRLLAIEPDLANAHVGFAYRLEAFGKMEVALAELKEAERLEPDNAQIHSILANFYENRGETESRIAELREAVRAQPYAISHRASLALALQTLGRLPEAIRELRELLTLDPKDSFTSSVLVDIYVSQKDLASAIAELRRSLKATSEGVDEATNAEQRWQDLDRLAELLVDSGDLDAAATIYLQQLRWHPDFSYVHNGYGNVLYDQGRIEDAIKEYREAIRLQPEMAAAHHNLANCLDRQKNLDGAIAEYRAALDLNPEEPHSRVRLGIALGKKGDLDAAISEFRRQISEKPDDPWGHANLGHAFELKHDPASAIPELKLALELDPDIPVTENDLAWLYATTADPRYRDPQAALQHAKHAVALLQQTPGAPGEETAAFLDTLAEALLLNGQAKEALATEERAFSFDEKNPELKTRIERFRKAALSADSPKH